MKRLHLVSLFLLSVTVCIYAEEAAAGNDCDINILDRCGAYMLLLGNREIQLPNSGEEFEDRCREIKNASRCVRDYSVRCLDNFSRQILKQVTNSANNVIEQACTPQGIEQYHKNKECFLATENDLHSCMETLISDMLAITNASVYDIIPLLCCSYARYSDCFYRHVNASCEEESRQLMKEIYEGYQEETNGLVCYTFTISSPECIEIKLPEFNSNDPPPISLFPPLLKIFDVFTTS